MGGLSTISPKQMLYHAAEQGCIKKFSVLDTKENLNAAAGYVSGERACFIQLFFQTVFFL
jgi:hypothetical protein